MECETRSQFNRGVNEFSQPRFIRCGEGSQGWEGVCRGLRLEAFGQVLLQLGDLVGLGIIFSLGPLGHLFDPVAGVPIVIDPYPAIKGLAQTVVERCAETGLMPFQFVDGFPNSERERRFGVEHEQELAIGGRLRFGVRGIDDALRQAEAQLEVLGDEFLPMFAEEPANCAVHQRRRDFRCRDPVGFVR